ncbi:MAG: hypothetical protein K2M06_02395, partial [Muribaculaceae bacterium]|nr:hypothetical protein [Muribaculaceae bacterium]
RLVGSEMGLRDRGWGWGPWYPGPGYPGGWSRPWQPTGIPGASHPHRPSYAGASGHGGAGYRPGQATTSSIGTVRPGNMGRGRYSSGTNSGITTSSSRRPGNMMPSSVNGGSNTGVRPGNSGRGREPGAPSPASRNRGSYGSSYNTGSSSSGSSGSYSSGSRGSSSFGGGSYGGGGRSGGGASGGRGRR